MGAAERSPVGPRVKPEDVNGDYAKTGECLLDASLRWHDGAEGAGQGEWWVRHCQPSPAPEALDADAAEVGEDA